MTEIRAFLEIEVGKDWEGGEADSSHFTDKEICKQYLAGLCIKTFYNECEAEHSDGQRSRFQKHKDKWLFPYYHELLHELSIRLEKKEKKIRSAQNSIKRERRAAFFPYELRKTTDLLISADRLDRQAQILEIESGMHASLQTQSGIDAAIANSMTSMSYRRKADMTRGDCTRIAPQQYTDGAKVPKYERDDLLMRFPRLPRAVNQQIIICSVCGGKICAGDCTERIVNHFKGKAHSQWRTMKDTWDLISSGKKSYSKRLEDEKELRLQRIDLREQRHATRLQRKAVRDELRSQLLSARSSSHSPPQDPPQPIEASSAHVISKEEEEEESVVKDIIIEPSPGDIHSHNDDIEAPTKNAGTTLKDLDEEEEKDRKELLEDREEEMNDRLAEELYGVWMTHRFSDIEMQEVRKVEHDRMERKRREIEEERGKRRCADGWINPDVLWADSRVEKQLQHFHRGYSHDSMSRRGHGRGPPRHLGRDRRHHGHSSHDEYQRRGRGRWG
ncbi:Luc7-related like protein [Aduncisulcus paluster]|uniref:Luc7-related like protein n=1 Tax=Aduncisulcus paluster TaxID=2918883 RepID=A0ABQ5KMQ4_9EUKA|nr:Luc7-related like protein [Aduncisulcus paluster]|eukprot:gnl/Carplike_NY0171/3049_a4096_357.p1 GENE.gnl/Carplike_NY0171/3049_a4096_357~~gnl/Carplike_NY0171/3049_a4096_357.p1  ORF type:complete len:502 (+),score=106.24 gnl/Carplike_NY0171/3049_a4096_357:12-1517(+)